MTDIDLLAIVCGLLLIAVGGLWIYMYYSVTRLDKDDDKTIYNAEIRWELSPKDFERLENNLRALTEYLKLQYPPEIKITPAKTTPEKRIYIFTALGKKK